MMSAKTAYLRLLAVAAETGDHELARCAVTLMRRIAVLAAERAADRTAEDRNQAAGAAR